jgi:8-oxo-dGTP diphosphatase
MLQFGNALPGRDYRFRPAAFGLVERDGLLGAVRVTRSGDSAYFDLPGGAIDEGESEPAALTREFLEETGLIIRPIDRIAEARQYFLRSDGEAVNNACGFWMVEATGSRPEAQCEDDHELVWLEPLFALAHLRHEAHAWAVARWLRAGPGQHSQP